MTGESSPVAMDVRIHVSIMSCVGILEIVGDTVGTVDVITGKVVTGCGAGWDVQPASTEVRMTSVIKRNTRIGLFLHENILIPYYQDNYQVSCWGDSFGNMGDASKGPSRKRKFVDRKNPIYFNFGIDRNVFA
jgi:hypothetical protein